MNKSELKIYAIRKMDGFKELKKIIKNIKDMPTVRVVHNMMLCCAFYDSRNRYLQPNHQGILYRWLVKNNLIKLLEADYE